MRYTVKFNRTSMMFTAEEEYTARLTMIELSMQNDYDWAELYDENDMLLFTTDDIGEDEWFRVENDVERTFMSNVCFLDSEPDWIWDIKLTDDEEDKDTAQWIEADVRRELDEAKEDVHMNMVLEAMKPVFLVISHEHDVQVASIIQEYPLEEIHAQAKKHRIKIVDVYDMGVVECEREALRQGYVSWTVVMREGAYRFMPIQKKLEHNVKHWMNK